MERDPQPPADADDRAFVRAALARYEKPLLRFARSIVGSAHAADVVQDTFVALCKAERSEVEAHLVPWLFTVCKNRALDAHRQRRRLEPLSDEEDDMQSPDSGPVSQLERRQSVHRIEAAMAALSDPQRQAVTLKFAAGLRYKEIAEVMQTSVSNVGVMLHTALKRIKDELGPDSEALLNARSAQ